MHHVTLLNSEGETDNETKKKRANTRIHKNAENKHKYTKRIKQILRFFAVLWIFFTVVLFCTCYLHTV